MPAKKKVTKDTKKGSKKNSTKETKKASRSTPSQKKSAQDKESHPFPKEKAKEVKEGSKVEKKERVVVKAILMQEKVITEGSDAARELCNQSCYGTLTESAVQLSLIEGLYLMQKGRLHVVDGRNKEVSEESYVKKAQKKEPNFWVRYCVFKDIRNRGYVIKTALKFGADFRIYNRGVKPGEDHAKWIVYPVHEGSTLTWHEFSAKNRVAHSTRKKLLMGVVDAEEDVTYYEVRWIRP
jgi:tRNA-intron endonuclease, archaea type